MEITRKSPTTTALKKYQKLKYPYRVYNFYFIELLIHDTFKAVLPAKTLSE